MANVLNRHTKQFLHSVNTPDFNPVDWIINPNLSCVKNVPWKYIKIVDDNVVEMTQKEKDVVDATELIQYKKEAVLAMKEKVALHLLTLEDKDFATFQSLIDAANSKIDVDNVTYPRAISNDSLEVR